MVNTGKIMLMDHDIRKGFFCKTFDIDREKWVEIIQYTIAEKDTIREIP